MTAAANRTLRTSERRPSPGRLYAEHRRSGLCSEGHDIASPGTRANVSGRVFCRACRAANGRGVPAPPKSGLCKAGLHPFRPGNRCAPCRSISRLAAAARAEVDRQLYQQGQVAKYLARGLPSFEILDGAACRPADAWLFEAISRAQDEDHFRVESMADGQARQARAIAICAGCPVRDLCKADGLKHTREGVYGGVAMSNRYHRALRLKAQACTPVDTRVQSAS